MGIGLPTSIIEIHHGLQVGQAAVVHVRSGLGNLAERGGLESTAIFDNTSHSAATFIGKTASIPPDTQIVENSVAEVVALMAKVAVSFALEQLHAFSCFRAQRRRVAGCILIVGRITRENGALKACECPGKVLARHGGPEHAAKGILVLRKLVQPVHDHGNARSHFDRILQRKQCLVFE